MINYYDHKKVYEFHYKRFIVYYSYVLYIYNIIQLLHMEGEEELERAGEKKGGYTNNFSLYIFYRKQNILSYKRPETQES